MSQFRTIYAHLYDRFHAGKNYELEAKKLLEFIQSINRDYEVTSILDMGCGTGAHLEAFANLGKQVAGYDISESMLKVASERVPNAVFYTKLPIHSLLVDLSCALFDVISYMTSEKDLQIFFKHAYTHTRNGGYFFADSWNYEGIILNPPIENKRQVRDGKIDIERSVVPLINNENEELFFTQGIVELRITLKDMHTKQAIVQENHKLRGWKPEVVSRMLKTVGFNDVRVFSVNDYSQVLENHEFRFGVIARKEDT